MPRATIPPLLGRFPIVDPATGNPTLPFCKIWQDFFQNEAGTFADAATANATADAAVPQSRLINTVTPIQGGGPLSADLTLSHNTSGVTAGSYTSANITVDADGHVTAAANGGGGGGGSTAALVASFTSDGNAGDAFASLGYYVTFPVGVTISAFSMILRPGAAGRTYTLSYAPYNTSTNKITSAATIAESYTSAASGANVPVGITLPTALTISAGSTYAFWISQTFGSTTTTPDTYFSNAPIGTFWFTIPTSNGLQLASNAPTTSDTWTSHTALWAISFIYSSP